MAQINVKLHINDNITMWHAPHLAKNDLSAVLQLIRNTNKHRRKKPKICKSNQRDNQTVVNGIEIYISSIITSSIVFSYERNFEQEW